MAGQTLSSGDLVADRRSAYADMLAAQGDWEAAIDVMTGALELVPDWAAGWFRLGELFEQAGRVEAAVDAWTRAIAADPTDALGAGLKRDLLTRPVLAESMPPAFVELLFDQYAPRFETSLVERLGYRGPDIMMSALRATGFQRADRALDLGCGTGLMGEPLRPLCGRLEGWDISSGMLSEARNKQIYDRLDKRDIGALDLGEDRYDLIVAADVFIYLGALERIMGWCAASLAPGGRLAFTVEAGVQPVELRDSRRFAHSRSYVEGLLNDAGFGGVRVTEGVLRQDRGADVASLCVIASASPFALDLEGDGEAGALV